LKHHLQNRTLLLFVVAFISLGMISMSYACQNPHFDSEDILSYFEEGVIPLSDTEELLDMDYILSKNSHTFHRPLCSLIGSIKEDDKEEYIGSRLELIELGYTACFKCEP